MSRPPVRKTENVKTAPVIGVIGGVFDRLQGKCRGFPVGDGPQAAPTAMRSMALRAEFSPFTGRATPPTPQKGLAKAGTVCYTFERCQYRRKELLK